ncbi:MAG: helix-turn-helix domain-containing protein [Rickettsiales bacterium]
MVALFKCSNVSYTETLIAAGAMDFLVIPCTLERLQTTIRNALALFYMRQNMEQWIERRGTNRNGYFNTPRAISLCHENGAFKRLKEIEAEIIAQILILQHGCLARTAKSLGIGRTTLYRKLKHSIHQSKEAIQALNPAIQDNITYLQHQVSAQEL